MMAVKIKKSSQTISTKRENALASSRYSIVRQEKETKRALEKSQSSLVKKR